MNKSDLSRFRRVTVMGLGRFGGGAGAARFFAGLGAEVTVTDAAGEDALADSVRGLREFDAGIRFVLGGHREDDFTDADLVVANQAVRLDNPLLRLARDNGVPVASETGLALALNPAPWIGITGSAGKSTTTALIHAMILGHWPDALLGGNIGGDLLTRVGGRPADSPVVAELSSYQLTHIAAGLAAGEIRPPRVAVLTNIAPNHLDWHRDMEEYIEAKRNLARFQAAGDWTVLNRDDPAFVRWNCPARVMWTSLADCGGDDAGFIRDDAIVLRLDGVEAAALPLAGFRLPGPHNRANAVQAAAAAYLMSDGDADAVRTGLLSFSGLRHRLETAAEGGGLVFVNDSKSTTPESAVTALRAMDRPAVIIAGGYDKKSPFGDFGREVQRRAAGIVLLGAAADRIRQAVLEAADARPASLPPLKLAEAGDDFEKAVELAAGLLPGGGCVLLSPACASWGMFTNYEERGAVFASLAEGICRQCSRD